MSSKLTGDIAKQYLTRFPETPALTLAKKMFAENPLVYTDIEHARTTIRHYIGQKGTKKRNSLADKQFLRKAGKFNPFQIPESDCDPWEPLHIPERLNSGLILSDQHFPYHDVRANSVALEHAVGHKKINFILINGDGLDFYQLSRFMKDPRKRSLNDEIWGWIEYLNILQTAFPGAKIYWKLGNHENRLEKYLFVKAPELLNMQEFKLSKILKTRGVENVEVIEKQIIYAGRLPFVHGTEFQSGSVSPVNPARGLFLKTLSSAVTSHHHRSSAHSETDINGKLMSWYSIGCLCGLHPEYALLNKWNLGFAYIQTEGLEFSFENMKIYNGKVYRD
jgi:hypothetical protein